jgi:hypothetical protein
VPKRGDVTDDFWLPLAARLRDLVQEEQCVRSEEGAWCRPRELLSRPANGPFSAASPLMSSGELQACLGLAFAAQFPRGHEHAHPLLREFSCDDLLACLLHPSFAPSLYTRPVAFHVAVCEFLSSYLDDAIIKQLRDLPIFVLQQPNAVGTAWRNINPSSHRLAALRQGPIFSSLPVRDAFKSMHLCALARTRAML